MPQIESSRAPSVAAVLSRESMDPPSDHHSDDGETSAAGGSKGTQTQTGFPSSWILGRVLLGLAYSVYLLCAVVVDWRRALPLVIMTSVVLLWKLMVGCDRSCGRYVGGRPKP